MFYVYFLKSTRNNKIYCGFSEKEPELRLKEHNNGTNKWTRENGPFLLLYYESYYCEKDARHKEKFYKTGFGRKIRDIILSSVSASARGQMSPLVQELTSLWLGLEHLVWDQRVEGSSPFTPTKTYQK